ncbi:MAG TPA: hypothetical protein VNN77_16180 [candidate division Zixibacteria bacterium]|nr:hypothetical protein [candidate division Zixibacteria bacterium]
METKKGKRGRRGERVSGNAFMDTARAAFVRYLALEKWREVDDLGSAAGLSLDRALEEAGRFPERGAYRSLWEERWRAEVRPERAGEDAGSLFAAIERVVRDAVEAEEAERRQRGDRALDEDPQYKAFIDRVLERLLREGDVGNGQ